jgi:hypothetical protein
VAVLPVFGERLSGFKFPVKRENTGKFPGSSREGEKTARFSDYKSATYTQIPCTSEQGIVQTKQGISRRKQGPHPMEQARNSGAPQVKSRARNRLDLQLQELLATIVPT